MRQSCSDPLAVSSLTLLLQLLGHADVPLPYVGAVLLARAKLALGTFIAAHRAGAPPPPDVPASSAFPFRSLAFGLGLNIPPGLTLEQFGNKVGFGLSTHAGSSLDEAAFAVVWISGILGDVAIAFSNLPGPDRPTVSF